MFPYYRTTNGDGYEISHREADDPSTPALLLHGFPTASHMFREQIPVDALLPAVDQRSLLGP